MSSFIKSALFVLSTFAFAPAAEAHEPGVRFLIAGGSGLAGEVLGVATGGIAGGAAGYALCGDSSVCLGVPILGIAGAGLGGIGGQVVGASVGANLADVRGGRTVAWSLAATGVGIGVGIGAAAAESDALLWTSAVTAILAPPLAAGLAAATDTKPRPSRVQVAAAPVVSRDNVGFRLEGRF